MQTTNVITFTNMNCLANNKLFFVRKKNDMRPLGRFCRKIVSRFVSGLESISDIKFLDI